MLVLVQHCLLHFKTHPSPPKGSNKQLAIYDNTCTTMTPRHSFQESEELQSEVGSGELSIATAIVDSFVHRHEQQHKGQQLARQGHSIGHSIGTGILALVAAAPLQNI